jgi:hypothetical protein
MAFLIGTDEAGYGPNYGPLCVAATVWEIDDALNAAILYRHLRRIVTDCVDKATKKRVCWADSKAVYKAGCGADHLERGVLAALALVDRSPVCWRSLWQTLDARCASLALARVESELQSSRETNATELHGDLAELPWHESYSPDLPFWMHASEGPAWMASDALSELAELLRAQLADSGVRLAGLLCRPVFPREFNQLVESANKAEVLSRITLSLIADALQLVPPGNVQIVCDKHGGRNFYQVVLQTQFPDDWVRVRCESSEESRYELTNAGREIEIGFYVSGERFLPVALASMTAKYLRETAMRPFNEFWCSRVPGLKPTAGYPSDAGRFKKAIAAVQQELAIDDSLIWRSR